MNAVFMGMVDKIHPLWRELLALPEDDIADVSAEVLAKLIRYALYKDVLAHSDTADIGEVTSQWTQYRDALSGMYDAGTIQAGEQYPVAVQCVIRGWPQMFRIHGADNHKCTVDMRRLSGWSRIFIAKYNDDWRMQS